MTLSPEMVTIDALDAVALGRWWAEQTGGTVTQENDGWFVVVEIPGAITLAFQKVEQPTPGKNKMHLDLSADDLDAAVTALETAGAETFAKQTMGDFSWYTMADPEGNFFDVSARG